MASAWWDGPGCIANTVVAVATLALSTVAYTRHDKETIAHNSSPSPSPPQSLSLYSLPRSLRPHRPPPSSSFYISNERLQNIGLVASTILAIASLALAVAEFAKKAEDTTYVQLPPSLPLLSTPSPSSFDPSTPSPPFLSHFPASSSPSIIPPSALSSTHPSTAAPSTPSPTASIPPYISSPPSTSPIPSSFYTPSPSAASLSSSTSSRLGPRGLTRSPTVNAPTPPPPFHSLSPVASPQAPISITLVPTSLSSPSTPSPDPSPTVPWVPPPAPAPTIRVPPTAPPVAPSTETPFPLPGPISPPAGLPSSPPVLPWFGPISPSPPRTEPPTTAPIELLAPSSSPNTSPSISPSSYPYDSPRPSPPSSPPPSSESLPYSPPPSWSHTSSPAGNGIPQNVEIGSEGLLERVDGIALGFLCASIFFFVLSILLWRSKRRRCGRPAPQQEQSSEA